MTTDTDEAYWKIEQHAHSVMSMYKTYKTESRGSQWAFNTERQVCRDCLESMKRYGLIKDYDLHECKIYME